MSGKLKRAVRERIIVIRRIYWRMSFKIMGGVYALISLATLGISEFGTDSVQHELLFRILIHRIPVWAWPTAALVIVAASGVEGGVQDGRLLRSQHDSALAALKVNEDAQAARALLEIEQGRWYEERTWVYVGDVGYTETPECEDDLIIRVRCRNEERIRWDDIPVTVKLPKPVHNRFALSSDS